MGMGLKVLKKGGLKISKIALSNLGTAPKKLVKIYYLEWNVCVKRCFEYNISLTFNKDQNPIWFCHLNLKGQDKID